jgi:glycosyltransferase involved in cell wall biosynthesis
MRVSFIIPAYNEEAKIESCLDSILSNVSGRHEIIVIDNASVDATARIAQRKTNVRVIRELRRGLCFARERGRREAHGEILVYLDADSRLPPSWIETATTAFKNNPQAVCISGPPLYYDASCIQELVLHFLWICSAPIAYRMFGFMVYGAHFIVKKEALDSIGGFDCSIDFYGEDTDLARRLSKVGSVIFQMDYRVPTSARRFKAHGMFRTCYTYAVNFLWPAIFYRPYSRAHTDPR